MPRKPSSAAPVESKADSAGPVVQEETPVDAPNENSSSETMVVLPAPDEPVRMGGHVLTEAGWVVETDPVPGATEDTEAESGPAPEQE
jgi:hypothetical protein